MKRQSAIPLSIAALSLALLIPASAQSPNQNDSQNGSMQSSQDSQNATAPPRGGREAMRMVAARAVLKQTLDADKVRSGYQFRATLAQKVQLNNGPELPSGTLLLGSVAEDDMNQAGSSKLALRFTEAVLKNGQRVPIKATIVGAYRPESMSSEGNPVSPGDEVPNSWNDGTLAVDQIGVLSGVDLHSRIASKNSGVFVSSTKKNVKLSMGSELALAIAAQNNAQSEMGGMSGSNQ
jgi:hypothetical protein